MYVGIICTQYAVATISGISHFCNMQVPATAAAEDFDSKLVELSHLLTNHNKSVTSVTATINKLSTPLKSHAPSDYVPSKEVQTSLATGNAAINDSRTQKPPELLPSDAGITEPIPPGNKDPGHHLKPRAAGPRTNLKSPLSTTAHNGSATRDIITSSKLRLSANPPIKVTAIPADEGPPGTGSPPANSSIQIPPEPLPSDPAIIEPIPPGNKNPGHHPKPPAAVAWPPSQQAGETHSSQ